MTEDMTVRGFGEKTQSDYIRHVQNFTIFLGRSPDMADDPLVGLLPFRYRAHPRAQVLAPFLPQAGAKRLRSMAQGGKLRQCNNVGSYPR